MRTGGQRLAGIGVEGLGAFGCLDRLARDRLSVEEELVVPKFDRISRQSLRSPSEPGSRQPMGKRAALSMVRSSGDAAAPSAPILEIRGAPTTGS
jgi:hypothetical protein